MKGLLPVFWAAYLLGTVHVRAETLRLAFDFDQNPPVLVCHPQKDNTLDDGGPGSFRVIVISNEAESRSLATGDSLLFEALSFEMTLEDGRVLTIERPQVQWQKNRSRTVWLGGNQALVFRVNFSTGLWKGLPAQLSKTVALKAHLHLETLTAESDPVVLQTR